MCSRVLEVGLARRTMSSTGWESMDSNSIGVEGRPIARVGLVMQSHLPWGIASP